MPRLKFHEPPQQGLGYGGLRLHGKMRAFDLNKFEEEILEAWDSYPEDKLDDLFNMKQSVLKEIINGGGWNSFKLPHRSAAEKRAR